MSRKLRFRALMGLVAVVAVLVGVLVYPPPKEAKAAELHGIILSFQGGGPAAFVLVEFGIQTGLDPDDPDDWTWEQTLTNGIGKAEYTNAPNTTATF